MQLIENGFAVRDPEYVPVIPPVKVRFDKTAPDMVRAAGRPVSETVQPCHNLSGGIRHNPSADLVVVFDHLSGNPRNEHSRYSSHTGFLRKGDFTPDILASLLIQQERRFLAFRNYRGEQNTRCRHIRMRNRAADLQIAYV